MKINSRIHIGNSIPVFAEDVIKNEPMFFNCSLLYALKFGGPITKAFFSALIPSIPKNVPIASVIFDSRVHMLMPGWFPCIPGYHHDDVPRSRSDGQPNYENPEYRSQHALALVNGDTCPTEFAIGDFEMPEVPLGEIIYKHWHPEVVCQLDEGIGYRQLAPTNTILLFDDRTFHQGVPAVKSGWRWFGRASWNTHRKATNEIRRQVQVYLENPMEGW